MFCRYCGTKLNDGAGFCRICGARLGTAAPVQRTNPQPAMQYVQQVYPQPEPQPSYMPEPAVQPAGTPAGAGEPLMTGVKINFYFGLISENIMYDSAGNITLYADRMEYRKTWGGATTDVGDLILGVFEARQAPVEIYRYSDIKQARMGKKYLGISPTVVIVMNDGKEYSLMPTSKNRQKACDRICEIIGKP